MRAKGVLYVTAQPTPDFGAKGVVDVYTRRMFVKSGEGGAAFPVGEIHAWRGGLAGFKPDGVPRQYQGG